MFWLIKQVLIMLLKFGESLATKYVSLNKKKPCTARPIRIDLDPVELNYYPLLFAKICIPSKTKDMNAEVFTMITRIYKARTLVKHFIWLQTQSK